MTAATLATASVFASFNLLLAAQPFVLGGAATSSAAAGAINFTVLASAVAAQVTAPHLAGRYGQRNMLAVAAIFLALPPLALAFLVGPDPGDIYLAAAMIAAVFRGLGFGLATVITATIFMTISTDRQHMRSASRFGLVTGIASLVCLPAGVLIANQWGASALYLVASAVGLASLIPALRVSSPTENQGERRDLLSYLLRQGRLSFAVMVVSAVWMILVTFLPLKIGGADTVATMLFLATGTRLVGRVIVTYVPQTMTMTVRLPLVGVFIGLCGIAAPSPILAFGGIVLLGLSHGAFATGVMVAILRNGSDRSKADAMMMWNVAIDLGAALGTMLFSVALSLVRTEVAWLLACIPLIPAIVMLLRGVPTNRERE